MIIDHLSNFSLYQNLSPLLNKVLSFLDSNNLSELPPGRHEIDKNDIYVMISEYTTGPEPQDTGEAHREYIDVQYMISGSERIGWAPLLHMNAGAYIPPKDYLPVTGSWNEFLTLRPGDFMVLWPHDAHMPGIATALGPTPVKKAVFKVRVQPQESRS